jgi:RNA polymerase sigma factor (sigma-70 family)
VTPAEQERLAARARDGDPLALAALYRHFAPSLLGFLSRALSDRGEAEDVLHDTFLRLLDGRRGDRAGGHLRAWLFTVAGHLAVDRLRRRRRHGELAAAAAEDLRPSGPPGPESILEEGELLRRIEDALADLPPAYGTAFHLRVREHFSYREMAEVLGEVEGTLRSRVHHTLVRVRRALEGSGYERPPSRAREESKE